MSWAHRCRRSTIFAGLAASAVLLSALDGYAADGSQDAQLPESKSVHPKLVVATGAGAAWGARGAYAVDGSPGVGVHAVAIWVASEAIGVGGAVEHTRIPWRFTETSNFTYVGFDARLSSGPGYAAEVYLSGGLGFATATRHTGSGPRFGVGANVRTWDQLRVGLSARFIWGGTADESEERIDRAPTRAQRVERVTILGLELSYGIF